MNKKKIKNYFTKNKKKVYESENQKFIKQLKKIRKNAIFEKEIIEIEFQTKKIKILFKFNILINPLFKGKKENFSNRINLKKYKLKNNLSLNKQECFCKFILLEEEIKKLKNNIYIDYLIKENKYYSYYNLEKTFFKFSKKTFILDCYMINKKKYKEIFTIKFLKKINSKIKKPEEIILKINKNKKIFRKLTNNFYDLELEETFLENQINNLKKNFDENIESSLKIKSEELLVEFNKIIKKKINIELDIEEKIEEKLLSNEDILEKIMMKNELLFETIENFNNIILKEYELNKFLNNTKEKIQIIKNKFPKIFEKINFFSNQNNKLQIHKKFFCSICCTRVSNIIYFCCFHLVSCVKCFKEDQNVSKKCFICKKLINGFFYLEY